MDQQVWKGRTGPQNVVGLEKRNSAAVELDGGGGGPSMYTINDEFCILTIDHFGKDFVILRNFYLYMNIKGNVTKWQRDSRQEMLIKNKDKFQKLFVGLFLLSHYLVQVLFLASFPTLSHINNFKEKQEIEFSSSAPRTKQPLKKGTMT